jgi:hypothetical protein
MRFSKEKKQILVRELRKIFDDDEFILGTLCDLQSDEDIDTLLAYIRDNEGVASEDVILFSMEIADKNL